MINEDELIEKLLKDFGPGPEDEGDMIAEILPTMEEDFTNQYNTLGDEGKKALRNAMRYKTIEIIQKYIEK